MAVDFIKTKFGYSSIESFMVIFLNTKNRIIKHKILFRGTVDQTAVYPREIIKYALELSSSGIIIAHNHPSGNCIPSDEDKKITKQIKDAAEMMKIRLLDHIIVGRNKYFSFAEKEIL
jgi:DNA repair protein RadC